MKTKIRLKIQLKLWHKGRIVFDSCLSVKDRVLRAVQVEMWDKAYLKINYGKRIFNDGYYHNLPDFKNALSAFTEKNVIEYLRK